MFVVVVCVCVYGCGLCLWFVVVVFVCGLCLWLWFVSVFVAGQPDL